MTEILDPAGDPLLRSRRHQVASARVKRLGVEVEESTPAHRAEVAPEEPAPRRPPLLDLSVLNPFAIKRGAGPWVLIIIGVTGLIGGADQGAVFALIPQMRATMGYDTGFLLAFSTVMNVFMAIFGPAMGYVADRVNRVWMVRLGVILTHLSAIGVGLLAAPMAIIGVRTAMGFGGAVSQGAQGPLIADYYHPDDRGRVYGFISLFSQLGGLFVPVAVGIVADIFGWRIAFISLGAAAMASAVLYFFLREPSRGEMDRVALGMDPKSLLPERPPSLVESLRAIRSIGTMRRLWVASVFLAAGGFANLGLPSFYADIWHLTTVQRGLILTATAAFSFAGTLLSVPILDRLVRDRPGRIMYLVGGYGLLAAGGLVTAVLGPWLWLSVLGSMIFGFASFMISPVFSPAIQTVTALTVPARIRGFGMQTIPFFGVLGLGIVFSGLGALRGLGASVQLQIASSAPFFVVAAAILASAAFGVERDIRAALASSVAEEEALRARLAGENKLLVCRDVDVVYDGAQVLFGVDFDVTEGEIVALLGTNGSGKSTLLRAISGLQEASNGAIVLDGVDVTHSPAHINASRGVVMVPGGRAIFPTLSVAENLKAAERLAGTDAAGLAARKDEINALFPVLQARRNQKAGDLSGGEQQMLSLGQAFLLNPRLLMIDELSLGLAPQVVESLLEAVRRIHAGGTTIVLVEQSVNVALTIAQRAVFMEKGVITYEGSARDLISRGDVIHSTFLGQAQGASLAAPGRRRPTTRDADGGPILVVGGVGVSYGGVRALSDVSFTINPGEVVGFIGPNGPARPPCSTSSRASRRRRRARSTSSTRTSPGTRPTCAPGRGWSARSRTCASSRR